MVYAGVPSLPVALGAQGPFQEQQQQDPLQGQDQEQLLKMQQEKRERRRQKQQRRRQQQQQGFCRPESVSVPPELLGIALERQHVDSIYAKIAPHFSHTRFWSSREACRTHLIRVRESSEVADGVICIAVLHHLTTEARRQQALRELARITRPGGRILIYVWAQEHEAGSVGERKFPSQDVLVPWVYQKHYDQARELRKTGGSAAAAASEGPAAASGSPASASVAREETFYRYYRVFSREDLLGLCAEEKRVKVLDCYNDTNNWARACRTGQLTVPRSEGS
ncbi:hypothetical protein, conserved [Eimeria acervulina]|uniref:Methyltransferase type 11 domain-containing protein n=1 Tax=Eimeria acervulina TaxID=5801 RepID=U6G7R0_EIMAC|nr:hypothetical protein, conserved [Eimeria acervulina]CDI76296.1 hypothetical protein, conserved [Eimeria acervulina]